MLTAVFDIGKTNKKYLLFDDTMSVVSSTTAQFDPVEDDDGEPCENLASLTEWMRATVNESRRRLGRDRISHINFSTYGASLVHLGEDGHPVAPLYNYLREYPDDILMAFRTAYDRTCRFEAVTGSPFSGMLSSGLQLYWIKKTKPDLFRRISTSLHLPQYCSYLFSGHLHDEATSLGCHTAMWDYQLGDYHSWMREEGMTRVVPPLRASDATFSAEQSSGGSRQIRVGAGVHDSSAALYPYLKAFDDPFIFMSTGTWIVTMNAFSNGVLAAPELDAGILMYLTPSRQPVKAARMFLGFEHDHHTQRIALEFGVTTEMVQNTRFDQALLDRCRAREHPFIPSTRVASGSAENDHWSPGTFDTYDVAYHALIDGIVTLELEAVALAQGTSAIKTVIVDGGFAKNPIFLKLLARALHPVAVLTTELAQATAFGAALLVNGKIEGENLRSLLNTRPVAP